jgi:hypothetical protein
LEELLLETKSVVDAGYDPITRNFRCPVCGRIEAVYSAITEHLHDEHVVADKDHFDSWRAVAEGKVSFYFTGSEAWRTWFVNPSEILTCTTCGATYGATCGASGVTFGGRGIRHQQSMLAPSSELYPYRQAIRNLWPEFASHPVFED